ncbi:MULTISPECIES: preprotein translocase subunit YajC [Prolixibacter]|jgi:preprotein translocase subunit YajC|uniref:Sec translocon accessory complex subunit YajC n=1 Tax=Prolixibacter denitrificans TaxID=1541063 RepID=A0A2P8C6N1_9BACT|nr:MULTISPECIES: preprotein translocase subunit YajC [Prolixibacter]PSK80629.1 preprotein translocase subunit YajC [Prolixibacter denitrificans]GET22076.1 preprotein translocase subunit YajC [Prolixibacter denitrificans]GET24768.1 preprotein translocase subunit YajC [Prolixibacter sp. NT017]
MMNNLLFVIAQQQTNPLMTFLPLVLIMVVFYFFMIRPQMKRQKELRNFRSSLQKGDKVVTTGGLYGRIVEIKDNIIFLEIAPNVKVKVDKSVVLKDISDAPQQK